MQLKFFTEISGSHWIGQPLESWTKSNLHFLNYSNDLEPFSNIIAELVSSLFLSSMKFLTRLNNYFLVYWNFWKPSFNNAYILSIWHRYLLGSVSVDTLFKRDEPPPSFHFCDAWGFWSFLNIIAILMSQRGIVHQCCINFNELDALSRFLGFKGFVIQKNFLKHWSHGI